MPESREESKRPEQTHALLNDASQSGRKEKFRDKLRAGDLRSRTVELTVEQRISPVQIFSNMGMEQMDFDLQGMLEKIMPRQMRKRHLKVREARRVLLDQEIEALVDKDAVHEEACVSPSGPASSFSTKSTRCADRRKRRGSDVSRQGVQRDLLPIVEGTTVQTALRLDQNRPHPVHRRRRLPQVETIAT